MATSTKKRRPLALQQIADIAMRWSTAMSDAMIVACVKRYHRTGEPLVLKTREQARRHAKPRVILDDEHVDWERLMRENSDTRWNHC